MEYKFRNELLNNSEFNLIFNELMSSKSISNYDLNMWSILSRDNTIMYEGYKLVDLLKLDKSSGLCREATFEIVMLLDKLGINSKAIYAENKYFIGSKGSYNGGHWYVNINGECLDTSLMIMGSSESFKKLGFDVKEELSLDNIFKRYSEFIDKYEELNVV